MIQNDVSNKPIGIFDSGVGGLSAVKALCKIAPNESIVYFGDTARVPYGPRDNETIITYAEQDMNFVLSHDVKAILIACGTVSSLATERLRELTDVPVVGIIEAAALSAVKSTKNKKIAIFGTQATVSSKSFEKEISRIDSSIKTMGVACPLFVPLVENGYIDRGNQISSLVAKEYLEKVIEFGVDTIILGCTHFPLLKSIIGELVPEIKLIDASKETAIELLKIINENEIASKDSDDISYRFFSSGSPEKFKAVGSVFISEELFDNVERVKMQDYIKF